jgi:hypothetical protein
MPRMSADGQSCDEVSKRPVASNQHVTSAQIARSGDGVQTDGDGLQQGAYFGRHIAWQSPHAICTLNKVFRKCAVAVLPEMAHVPA